MVVPYTDIYRHLDHVVVRAEYHLIIVRALVNTACCPEVAILLRSTLCLDAPAVLQNKSWQSRAYNSQIPYYSRYELRRTCSRKWVLGITTDVQTYPDLDLACDRQHIKLVNAAASTYLLRQKEMPTGACPCQQ